LHFQAVALRILHQGRRTIESHRLIIEHGCRERRQVMTFQISTGICNKREAGCMRFGKSIERERSDGVDDLILNVSNNAVLIHPLAQLDFDFFHSTFGSLKSEGATQLLRLASAETSSNHSHAQKLFLK